MSDDESSVVDANDESPLEEAAAGVMTALVLLVAFGLLALDVSWFWIAFPVGFGGLLPAAVGLARYYQQSETSDAGESAASDDPVEALKKRYARGEIDEAEFERRLDDLLGTDAETTAGEASAEPAERDAARE
ncbi:MAG: putative membrane protein (DUF2078) [Halonotius sp. J07HN6]|jgi:Predicted membrane protein (DUF2078).|nr:MAG: putative membrane protein (DUF2078) [Halonotius sp. J07HN6]